MDMTCQKKECMLFSVFGDETRRSFVIGLWCLLLSKWKYMGNEVLSNFKLLQYGYFHALQRIPEGPNPVTNRYISAFCIKGKHPYLTQATMKSIQKHFQRSPAGFFMHLQLVYRAKNLLTL